MITDDVKVGKDTIIYQPELVNLFGCTIGSECRVGAFVEIGRGVVVGDRCKIEAYVFIPTGVTLEDEVFLGPHVCFINDKNPRAVGDWSLTPSIVKKGASIGANSTILCGVTIGENAMVGAGSVVTRDIPPNTMVYGNPARIIERNL